MNYKSLDIDSNVKFLREFNILINDNIHGTD